MGVLLLGGSTGAVTTPMAGTAATTPIGSTVTGTGESLGKYQCTQNYKTTDLHVAFTKAFSVCECRVVHTRDILVSYRNSYR